MLLCCLFPAGQLKLHVKPYKNLSSYRICIPITTEKNDQFLDMDFYLWNLWRCNIHRKKPLCSQQLLPVCHCIVKTTKCHFRCVTLNLKNMHASYSKCSCNCFLFIAIFVRLHDCNMRNLSLWDLWIISFRSEGRTSWWNRFIQLSALQRRFSVTSSKWVVLRLKVAFETDQQVLATRFWPPGQCEIFNSNLQTHTPTKCIGLLWSFCYFVSCAHLKRRCCSPI